MHPLCQYFRNGKYFKELIFFGKLCSTIAQYPTMYCIDHLKIKGANHLSQSQCNGITSKGLHCKSKQTVLIHNKSYCRKHQD